MYSFSGNVLKSDKAPIPAVRETVLAALQWLKAPGNWPGSFTHVLICAFDKPAFSPLVDQSPFDDLVLKTTALIEGLSEKDLLEYLVRETGCEFMIVETSMSRGVTDYYLAVRCPETVATRLDRMAQFILEEHDNPLARQLARELLEAAKLHSEERKVAVLGGPEDLATAVAGWLELLNPIQPHQVALKNWRFLEVLLRLKALTAHLALLRSST